MPGSNPVWLDVRTGVNELLLQEYHQQYEGEFWSRGDEKPQILMFIGDKLKAISMQNLFTLNGNHKRCKINLRKVPKERAPKSPLLIADCGLHNANSLERALGGPVPADIDQRPITPTWRETRSASTPLEISILIYGRLISLFSTVICLFADDIGGINKTAEWVSLWLLAGNRCLDLPPSGYPRVLVLKEWNSFENGNFDEKVANVMFMKLLHKEILKEHGDLEVLLGEQFGAVRVLALPTRNQENPTGYDRSWTTMLTRIRQESYKVQRFRKEAQMEFSAKHLKALFHAAYNHFTANWETPFSFVAATRSQNPVPSGFATHLMNFLQKKSKIKGFAVPIIASALNLDSHPPGMHCK